MIRIRKVAGGVILPIRAVPGAARSRVSGEHDGALKVAVGAVALEGRANRELVDFLAETLGVRRAAVRLAAGEKSRRKEVCIEGGSAEGLAARLRALGVECRIDDMRRP